MGLSREARGIGRVEDVVEKGEAFEERMKLRRKDRWILVLTEQTKFPRVDGCRGIVLVSEMAIRAQGQEVEGVIVARVFVDVMELRVLGSADGTTVVELSGNLLAKRLREIFTSLHAECS
jgi:hypothetical protein